MRTTKIRKTDETEQASTQLNQNHCDELLGAVETIEYGLGTDFLQFPAIVQFPDPPDATIECDKTKLSLEVTRLGSQRLSQVLAHAGPGDLVEINPELWKKGAQDELRKLTRVSEMEIITPSKDPATNCMGLAGQDPSWKPS